MATQDDQKQLLSLADRVLLKNYRQPPMVLVRGKGVELWDAAGKRYLDMTAGIAVCCLGHAHPALQRSLAEQAGTLVHTSNLFFIEQQIRAAAHITDRCFGERVFFCNSGAEANEAALKLARRYQHEIAGEPSRHLVVSTDGSFHGRSIATLAITGQGKYREGFGPLFGPVEFVPFGDLEAAARALEPKTACAFIVEPIQAEGGIVVPPAGYLTGLRKLADDTGTILIFDEVQTGVGRTGLWFGHQHEEMEPDVMTLAKGLGGGVPIGAVTASEKAAQGLSFLPGGAVPHASTFGGNPLACAAASTVFETIESEGLLESCRDVGDYLGARLAELVEMFPSLCAQARGRGLLRGLAMAPDSPVAAAAVVAGCRDEGVLFSIAGGSVVRFAPALIAERAHIDEAVEVLTRVLKKSAAS
jgi:predicted acetylornithine/succinylornithine family transaminase